MYCVTYSETVSQAWAARTAPQLEPQKRRVYRWGTHWGILGPSGKWICESRTQMMATDEYLVEACVPRPMDVLPKEMDDIWEEEYISLPKGLEYTGLVILRGDGATVLELAGLHGLPTPVLSALPSLPHVQAQAYAQPPSHIYAQKQQSQQPQHQRQPYHLQQSRDSKPHQQRQHVNATKGFKSRCMIQD